MLPDSDCIAGLCRCCYRMERSVWIRSEAGGVPHRGCSGESLRRASSSWTWCSSTRKVWGMMDRRLLHLIRLFGLTAEGTLVHEGDLLCEEFQLGSDGVKLQLQAFDDGDKDMLVQPVKLVHR